MQTPVEVDPLVLLAATLLAGGVLVAGLTRWVRVPGSLLFLGLEMLVGDDGLALVRFDDPTLARNLGVLALLVILFEGGLTTKPGDLRRAAGPGVALATVGVVITAAVTAVLVHLLLGVELLTAALVGAAVASNRRGRGLRPAAQGAAAATVARDPACGIVFRECGFAERIADGQCQQSSLAGWLRSGRQERFA